MSYKLFIKFDPNLGPDAIATDYSVLGEENFQKILDFCEANPPKTYLTREDLGGIGLVDYLIVPTSFCANFKYPIGAFQEKENVYYLPINILAFYETQNLLSTYHQEVYFNEEIIDTLKSILFNTLIKWTNHQDNFLMAIETFPNNVDAKETFENYKREMLENFPTIIRSRVDLVFTDQALRYHILYFLTNRGIQIDAEDVDLELYFPIFLRYMAKLNPSKAKEKLYIKGSNEFSGRLLVAGMKKGDVVLTLANGSYSKYIYSRKMAEDLLPSIRYNNCHHVFDLSTQKPYRTAILGEPVYLNIFGYAKEAHYSFAIPRQGTFIREHFFKGGRFTELLSQERILGVELRIQQLEERHNFQIILSYIYLNDLGFLSLEDEHIDADDITSIQLFFIFFLWKHMVNSPKNYTWNGFSVVLLQEKYFYHYLGVLTEEESEKGLLTISSTGNRIVRDGDMGSNYFLEKSRLVDFLRTSSRFITSRETWRFEKYFDNYKSSYNKFFSVLEQALTESYRNDSEDVQSFELVFNTVDQSLVCKVNIWYEKESELFRVNRDGEYAIPHINGELQGLTEEDIVDFYIAFIKNLFDMQKELVAKYGTIEYQIELKLPLHGDFAHLSLPRHSVERDIFLLSGNNEKLHIMKDNVWFNME